MDEFRVVIDTPGNCRSLCDWICYLIILGIIIWVGLSFNLKGPRCYVQEFYVPALDLSEPSSNGTVVNPCLFFDLTFENILTDRSIRYGDINLTFSYGQNAVANYIVPSFYQGKGKTARRREILETRGMPWEAALMAVSNKSNVVFRLDLKARPKFRFWFWYSKKKGVRIGANVEVDGSGMKIKKNKIKLNSVSRSGVGVFVLIPSIFITTYLLHFH